MTEHHPSKAAHFRTKYRPVHQIKQLFTGTSIALSSNQGFVLCPCVDKVYMVDVASGATLGQFHSSAEEDTVLSIALSPNDEDLVICSKSAMMKLCSVSKRKGVQQWKGHDICPNVMKFHPDGSYLAAGSADLTVCLWDVHGKVLGQRFKVPSIPLCIGFHPTQSQLMAVGDQVGTVTLYHTGSRNVLHQLKNHFSHCTSLLFTAKGDRLLTSSRDKTVQVYDVSAVSGDSFAKKVKSWIVVEEILSVAEWDATHVLVGGSSGQLRTYNGLTGELVSEAAAYPHALLGCHYLSDRQEAVVVTADQCILFYSLTPGQAPTLTRTLAGHLDAVADIRWLDGGKRFVTVTNSLHPRIYSTGSNFCQELHGHTDIVGSLAVSSDSRLVASAGKDMVIRVWYVKGRTSRCIGQLKGHLAYIMGLAFTHTVAGRSSLLLLISTDCEGFARVWNCSPLLDPSKASRKGATKKAKKSAADSGVLALPADAPDDVPPDYFFSLDKAENTLKVSDGSLNAVAVSPNNVLVATGGKDKVVRIWKLKGNALTEAVPLKGHRRPITAIQFSPVDKLVLSCCSYGHAMLWNLVDYQCLTTFQNDRQTGIYNCHFLNQGLQVATTDSAGMLKLWVVKTAECSTTVSEHSDEDGLKDVWALDVTPDDQYIITGGTDSCINILKDFTEQDQQEEVEQQQTTTLDNQRLQNSIRQGHWEEALLLALQLKRKHDARVVLSTMLHSLGDTEAPGCLDRMVRRWSTDTVEQVVRYCRDWNTHSHYCHTAQAVLAAVFRIMPPAKLMDSDAMTDVLEALAAYNARHYARLSGLLQKTYLLDLSLAALDPMSNTLPADISGFAPGAAEGVLPAAEDSDDEPMPQRG